MSDDILIYNELPWDRVVSGPIPTHVVSPRGDPLDVTSGRHFQDRSADRPRTNSLQAPPERTLYPSASVLVPPTEIPGYGYTLVSEEELLTPTDWPTSNTETVSTDRYEVTFDVKRGGIKRLYDTVLDRQLVDQSATYPLGGFVHECLDGPIPNPPRRSLFDYPADVDDWKLAVAGIVDAPRGFKSEWQARRTGPTSVKQHQVHETPLGVDVRQRLTTPTVESDVQLRVFFPSHDDEIVVEATWEMGMSTAPESTYLAFPFDIDDPTARIDVGGQPVRVDDDQLPGTCRDYFATQQWADISNDEMGITVGCPLNPMVQIGDFNFGQNHRSGSPETGHLLGWVTNNYWDTNFRARQPGRVHARYHLSPHNGPFEESSAHKMGTEAMSWTPVAQSLTEPAEGEPVLSSEGSMLDLPEPPILVFQIRQLDAEITMSPSSASTDSEQGLVVGLQNASDSVEKATIGSAALRIEDASVEGLLDRREQNWELDVSDGQLTIEMPPRSRTLLRLCTAPRQPTDTQTHD